MDDKTYNQLKSIMELSQIDTTKRKCRKNKSIKCNKVEAGVAITEGVVFTALVYGSLIGTFGFGVPITVGAGCWLLNKKIFNDEEDSNTDV